MLKLITILTGCSVALAVSVQAAKPQASDKKSAPKPKTVQKQQVAPKQHTAPSTHVQKVHTQHQTNAVSKPMHSNVSKKQARTVPAVQSSKLPTVQSNKVPLNKQTVKKIQAQHLNFHAKPNTAIASAQFNPNYRIEAAQNWNGAQYDAFRSYQPQWHDQSWWSSRYATLSLISGGWYFWDAGYWYPAWGYDEAAAYYPYDGPIYVGPRARPFDQVVADVQSLLQDMGFYKGEVDGLVGPLTQQAVAAYQSSQGLPPTAAIDRPTLDSLGLG
jgi:putative peptidoglycan binding protein